MDIYFYSFLDNKCFNDLIIKSTAQSLESVFILSLTRNHHNKHCFCLLKGLNTTREVNKRIKVTVQDYVIRTL